ncbi:MAG: FAD-binding protein [Acidimicrobiales bacterium]
MQIAVTVKQVPTPDSLALDSTGRLRRTEVALEMSAYCRRALAKGVDLARKTGGRCTVLTLGPPSAEDVLREALAFGADAAVLLSDPVFAGSDTLVTARALAGLAEREGPFDLILVGRSSLDAETGQVGPQLAELLDLPFAGSIRELELAGGHVLVRCEQDDGACHAVVQLPAVLAVAERLCPPAKVPREVWAAIPSSRVKRLGAGDIPSSGPWGERGSPTRVGALQAVGSERTSFRCSGPIDAQVRTAFTLLAERDALAFDHAPPAAGARVPDGVDPSPTACLSTVNPSICILVEPGHEQLARPLLGLGATLAASTKGCVAAIVTERADARELWSWGADMLIEVTGATAEEDVAAAVSRWAADHLPEVLLASATSWGREVASRIAARLAAGLVGDALSLEMEDGRLHCAKPAFSGSLVATITTSSAVQMATVRPGVLPVATPRRGMGTASVSRIRAETRNRVRVHARYRDDDIEALARAAAVVGVGAGVSPERYDMIHRLADLLGAELAATRKVTDRGWLPRSRQVGITGRSISPKLYIAVGISGKLNHLVGVRGAGTILAINSDYDAPVFQGCDIGILGDWREIVPLFISTLAVGAQSVS